MSLRSRIRVALASVSLVSGALCGWAGAPLWLIAAMLAGGVFVALRPLGQPVAEDEIETLLRELGDARGGAEAASAEHHGVRAVVMPTYMTLPLRQATRMGAFAWCGRSLLLRDEIAERRWHQLATVLRMQPAQVETRGNVLARFIDFALAKPKQL